MGGLPPRAISAVDCDAPAGDVSLAVICFCSAFAWFALSATPGVGWYDAGELGAAALTHGVAHPTGFPFALLIAKAVSVVPLGPLAFRAHLTVAVLGALVAGIIGWSARRAGISRPASALAALAWSIAPTVHLHATAFEVYVPAALVVFGVLAWSLPRRDQWALAEWVGWGLAVGVAAGTHIGAVLAVGACGVARWLWLVYRLRNGRAALGAAAAALCAACAVVGLAAATLALNAAADGWRNWGNPADWHALCAHLSANTIRSAFASVFSADSARIWLQAKEFGLQLWASLGGWLLLAALAWAHPGARRLTALAWLVAALDAAYSVVVNPMGIEARQTGVIALGGLALAGAVGLDWIVRRLPPRLEAVRTSAIVALACVALLPPLIRIPELWARGRDQGPDLWIDELLADVGAGAAVASQSDHSSGGLAFRLGIEGGRPDVGWVTVPMVYDPHEIDRWRRVSAPHHVSAASVAAAGRAAEQDSLRSHTAQMQWFAAWIRELLDRGESVHWELGQASLDRAVAPALTPRARLWVASGREPPPTYDRGNEAEEVFRRWRDTVYPPSDAARRVLGLEARFAALAFESLGDRDSALRLAATSVRIAPSLAVAWANLAALLMRDNKPQEARLAAERAHALDPGHPATLRNLARLAAQADQWNEAERYAAQAVELSRTVGERSGARALLEEIRAARLK